MTVSHFVSRAGWLLALGVAIPAFASNSPTPAKQIQVEKFEVGSGVQVPDEYRSALQQHLVEVLKDDKNFSNVVTGPASAAASDNSVRLTGTITEFEAGSKKKRLLTGNIGRMGGAGATRMKSHVKLTDAADKVLWEGDVAASEKGSMWNPAAAVTSGSINVTRTEAKDITKELDKALKHSDK